MRSANPALKPFQQPQTWDQLDAAARGPKDDVSLTMTIGGTVNASLILVGLCAAAGIASWTLLQSQAAIMWPGVMGGAIGGLILALIIMFKPRTAPYLAPVYAILEGVFLGGFSLIVAQMIGTRTGAAGPATGIVFQALLLTFGILFSLLMAYRAGLIRVGGTMRRCVAAAFGGVLFLAITSIVMRLIGYDIPLFHELFGFGKAGLIGIGFSVFMIVLGSFFLVIDFQDIEAAAKSGAPKYMEWYGAFSLLLALVWLYIESLRLLSKLRE